MVLPTSAGEGGDWLEHNGSSYPPPPSHSSDHIMHQLICHTSIEKVPPFPPPTCSLTTSSPHPSFGRRRKLVAIVTLGTVPVRRRGAGGRGTRCLPRAPSCPVAACRPARHASPPAFTFSLLDEWHRAVSGRDGGCPAVPHPILSEEMEVGGYLSRWGCARAEEGRREEGEGDVQKG